MNDEHDGFDEPQRKKGMHGCVVAAIVCGGVCAIFVAGIVALSAPAIMKAKQKANRMVCLNNLKDLAKLSLMYADENDGTLPSDLEELLEQFPDFNPDLLICPSDDSGASCSYKLVPRARTTDPGTTPLIREINSKHSGGENMAFVDGHVEWVEE